MHPYYWCKLREFISEISSIIYLHSRSGRAGGCAFLPPPATPNDLCIFMNQTIPYTLYSVTFRLYKYTIASQTFSFKFRPASFTLAPMNPVAPARHITPQNICSPVYFPPSASMIAPPMGVLHSAAILMMANMDPVRTPICLTSEICAISAGARDTKAPLPKP